VKIAYVHHGLWPSDSPSVSFVTRSAQGFVEAGAAFTLVTVRNTARPTAEVLRERFGIRHPLPITLLRAGPLRRQHPVVHALAAAYLLPRRWDALITRNLGFLPWALALRGAHGGRVVFESHDFYSDLAVRAIPTERPRHKLRRREHRYLSRVDGILCQSELQRAAYAAIYPRVPGLVAPTGVHTEDTDTDRAALPPVAGYIGTFDATLYDFEVLLAGFAQVRLADARLVIAGGRDEGELARMRARAAAHGLESRVEVLPWSSGPALAALRSRIRVGVAPWGTSGRNRMILPLKVPEYLSAGLPVIATDVPAIRDLLRDGHGGLLVPPVPEAWAVALTRLLSDGPLTARLSAEGRDIAREQSWTSRARRIVAFLETLPPLPRSAPPGSDKQPERSLAC